MGIASGKIAKLTAKEYKHTNEAKFVEDIKNANEGYEIFTLSDRNSYDG